MTEEDIISYYGEQLFADHAPALIRAEELEKIGNPARVFIAARYTQVSDILRDEDHFSLSQYDMLLSQVAGEIRYFVGENTAGRQRRLAMLTAAQNWIANKINTGTPPHNEAYLTWVATIAREEASQICAILQSRKKTGESVNLVREFGFLSTYRISRRICGVAISEKTPVFAKLLMLMRNLLAKGRWIRMRGELGSAMALIALLHLFFGHVFGTIVQSPLWLRIPTKWAADQALKSFDHAIAYSEFAPPESLLCGLMAVRPQFHQQGDDEIYASDVRSILFELTAAVGLIIGKSFADIAGFLAAHRVDPETGADWKSVAALLRESDTDGSGGKAPINELMRLAAGNRLIRTVRNDVEYQGVALRGGDRIVLLVNLAARDPAAFPNPGKFQPDPNRPLITFGPLDGPHACYGQSIARTVLREMILIADASFEPCDGASLHSFFGIPDDMDWLCKQTLRPAVRRASEADDAPPGPHYLLPV